MDVRHEVPWHKALVDALVDSALTSDDSFDGDLVQIDGFEPIRMRTLDWSADPFGHPRWRHRYHSLDFLWPLIARRDDRSSSVVVDWLIGNPPSAPPSDYSWAHHTTAKRARVMTAAHLLWPSTELESGLRLHGEILSDPEFYARGHNHGTSQDISLILIGSVLKNLSYVELGITRAAEASMSKVDRQGMVNEQAPAYQAYVIALYKEAERLVQICGHDPSGFLPDLVTMQSAMRDFIMPDGYAVPIGDTYWNAGGVGARFTERTGDHTAVYEAGYIIVRNSQNRLYAAMRFGPGRHIHGHDDHTSLFLLAYGQPRLTEAGHVGYERSTFRDYLRSPWAHNVVVLSDADFNSSASTALTRCDGHSFAFEDQPYPGVLRQRSIDMNPDTVSVAVVDSVASSEIRTAHQLWHLPPSASVTIKEQQVHVRYSDGARMQLTQIDPVDEIRVIVGSEIPLLGWTAYDRNRTPSPVIVSTSSGTEISFSTTIDIEPPGRYRRFIRPATGRSWWRRLQR